MSLTGVEQEESRRLAEAVRAAVRRITEPTRLPIELDDGTTMDGVVPSLWQLANEALATGNELAEPVTMSRPHRSPIDLDLMEILKTITEVTGRELRKWATVDGDVPAQLRRLAEEAINHEPAELDYWEHRFAQWGRVLAHYLAPVNRGRRLRASCPRCLVDRVRIEGPGGEILAFPIYVTMTAEDRAIYHARCQNADCGYTWFRGEALHMLADELAAMPRRVGPLRVAERTLEPT